MKLFCVVALLLAPSATFAAEVEQSANPVRKVVTMLQMMQNKVTAEGKREEELFEKFMCYCENADKTLGKSIEEAKTKIPQLESEIKEAIALKAQLEEDLKKHRADREAAKEALAKATAIREKEAAEFAKETGEMKSNLDAMDRAIAAISKGMTGFLQTSAASVIRNLLGTNEHALSSLGDMDREALTSFLSEKEGSEYAPASGEIVGILKQMKETMDKDLGGAIAEEEAAIKAFEELKAAKEAEIEACTKAIEEKLKRLGEISVEIVNMKNDLEDTQEALGEDVKFLADLQKNCDSKKKEWSERVKTRAEELLALADVIKLLSDDDALELFKKTLPSGAASFVQIDTTAGQVKQQALALIQEMRSNSPHKVQLDFIAMALKGKKAGFEKIIKLIDDMVVLLKKEQTDDDNHKEYCTVQLDLADDKKKATERQISDLETKISDDEEAIATLADEIKALQDGIAALDKSVAEATEQRKQENADFTQLMAEDSAAKELIGIAKNRLNKFYNPKLYKPPPKRELTEEERITLNMGGTLAPTNPPAGIGGTGVTVLASVKEHREAPPPPPETFGEYSKKSEESNGVISMMDMLAKDLDKEMTEAQAEEKLAQEDYEEYMGDSAEKRAQDSKTLGLKEGEKAAAEEDLAATKAAKKGAEKDLVAVNEFIRDLHADCDFLLENFDLRKNARADEIDALGKAKAVLSGANYGPAEEAAEEAAEE